MREIDQEEWSRADHFHTFRNFHYPHFTVCADVDVAHLKSYVAGRDVTFTAALVYIITRAANAIPEFRTRIRGDIVVEHDVVHPSATILVESDLFSFCTLTYEEDFSQFAAHFAERVAEVVRRPTLSDPADRDDLLYMTAIPWISFTSFSHPILSIPADSIPRFAWGRYRSGTDETSMPLSVQGHHALMDGLHVGRYYAEVTKYLEQPERVLEDRRQRGQR